MINLIKSPLTGYVAFLVVLLLLGWQNRVSVSRGERIEELNSYIAAKNDTIQTYKNRNGQLVTTIAAQTVSEKTMRDILKSELGPILKTHFDGVNKRMNNVETVLGAKISAAATFNVGTTDSIFVVNDTLKTVWTFNQSYKEFSLSGYVEPLEKRVFATPRLTTTLLGVEILKKQKPFGFLRKKLRRFEMTSSNPFITIDSLNFITVHE